MKIEVLYLSGCPHHRPAVQRVREILREEDVTVDLKELEVKDSEAALSLRFLGSPSIRIDGQDIEEAARASTAFGITCRTYLDHGQHVGVPPIAWLRTAIREALGGLR